jgi:hypothetical protein
MRQTEMLSRQGRWLALGSGLGAMLVTSLWAFHLLINVGHGAVAGLWVLRGSSSLIYSLALVWVCRAGWLVARGHAFERLVPVLLSRVGWSLAAAALADLLLLPWLINWAYPAQWSGIARYDPAFVAIGVLGGLLTMIAAMMRRAVAMADELEGFV